MKNKILTETKFKQSAVFFLIISLFLVSCANEPELPTADEAQTVIWEKIQMANDRWASGDPMGFLECSAQDITWSEPFTPENRVSGYEAMKVFLEGFKGQIPPHKHELLDPMFQFYDDMMIVTYRYQATIEGEIGDPWKVTAVYRYVDGDWLSVHENWSEVKQ
jgi:nuclear transport factor 2 (NTF2) superfamily protein